MVKVVELNVTGLPQNQDFPTNVLIYQNCFNNTNNSGQYATTAKRSPWMIMELPEGIYQTGDNTLPDDISHIKVPGLMSATITDKEGKTKTLNSQEEYDFCTDGYWSNDRIVKVVVTQIKIPEQPIPVPKLDTEMYFSTDIQTGVAVSCGEIATLARTSGSVENFMNNYKLSAGQIYDNLNKFYTDLSNPLIDQTQAVSPVKNYDLIDKYLKIIDTNQLPVLRQVYTCLNESLSIDPEILQSAERAYETSKARYESISPDHERVSYYEGWFPIFRPVRESSLFILFGISVILLIISILFFLQLGGLQVHFILPDQTGASPMFDLHSVKVYIYSGIGCGILAAGIGKYYNWF
jgi:hypothetical protein